MPTLGANDVGIRIQTTADNAGLESAEQELGRLQGSAEKAGSSIGGFFRNNMAAASLAATGLVTALGLSTVSALKQAGAYEQSAAAFSTLLGSADKAKTLLTDISKFASKTPFELPQVVEGSKNLLSYGVAAKDIIPTFGMLGDLSMGNAEKMKTLVTVYGQVRASGKLMGGDMLQLNQSGVPVLDALAKKFGVTKAEVMDMSSKSKISFDDMNSAMQNLTGKGGLFFGMMDKQSHTFMGTLSNVSDSLGGMIRLAVGIGVDGDIRKGSLFDFAKNAATGLMNALQTMTPYMQKFVNVLEHNKDVGAAIAGVFAGLAVLIGVTFVSFFGGAIVTLGAFVAAGAAVALIANEISKQFGGWGNVMTVLKGTFDAVVKAVGSGMDALKAPVTSLIQAFTRELLPSLQKLNDLVGPTLVPALKFIASVIGVTLFSALWLIINTLTLVAKGISNGINSFVDFTNAIINGVKFIAAAVNYMRGHFFESIGMIIGFFLSLPVKMIAAVGLGIGSILNMVAAINWGGVFSGIGNGFGSIMNGVKNAAMAAFDFVKNINWASALGNIGKGIGNTIMALIEGALNGAGAGLPGFPKVRLPRFAQGVRNFGGGMAIVGENGPEVVQLPRGSNVRSNEESKSMRVGGGGGTNIYGNIYLGDQSAVNEFFRRIGRNQELAAKGLTTTGY